MKENRGTPKNKWSQIFRKKWFFPSLYLSLAALLLAGIVWYQSVDTTPTADEDIDNEQQEESIPTANDNDAEPVVNQNQQEVIQFPLSDPDQAEIVTKFYDYNASEEDQLGALVFYNNRYYQSKGIDISAEEPFEVVASISGEVTEVKEDPLLGNVVVLSHGDEIMTYYSSLGDVAVTAGQKVKQGDVLGTAGQNIFGKENGTHLHFELRKSGNVLNPEEFFDQPVSSLAEIETEEVAEDPEANEESAASEEPEANEDTAVNENEEQDEEAEESSEEVSDNSDDENTEDEADSESDNE